MSTKSSFTMKPEITNGPTFSTIVDAFKYAYDNNNPHTVTFTVKNVGQIEMKICSIEHEDGSGESLNLKGYLKHNVKIFTPLCSLFEFYYNAKTHKGYINMSTEQYHLFNAYWQK